MTAATSTPSRMRVALMGLAGMLVVLILVQATLAGRFLFSGASIDVHGYIGNASFLLGLGLGALAVVGRAPRIVIVLAGALLGALFGQIGLGYVGRETAEAAAWHIPLGVTCLGLASAVFVAALLAPNGSATVNDERAVGTSSDDPATSP